MAEPAIPDIQFRLDQLVQALRTAPPPTLQDLADVVVLHVGGSITFWHHAAGLLQQMAVAGDERHSIPVPTPADEARSTIETAASVTAMLIVVQPRTWYATILPTVPSAQSAILHALISGWAGRLIAEQPMSSDLLRAIVDELPEGIIVSQAPDGRVVLTNRAAEALCGQPITGLTIADYMRSAISDVNGEPFMPEQSGIVRALSGRGPMLHQEAMLRQPDGTSVPVLANTAPLCDATGNIIGAVAVFQDISAWRRQEKDRDTAIAGIAHDLKNPLTTIRGTAELLLRHARRRTADERELRRITAIIEQADRMSHYLSGLVDVARLHSGELPLQRQLNHLATLIEAVVTSLNTITSTPRVQLHIEANPVATIDAVWVERAIVNLVDNALKYSPPESIVVVELSQTSTMAVIKVHDQGAGIEPDDLEAIFVRFNRGRNTARRFAGTGLGLYTVRAVVQAHGGVVKAQSAGPNQGSTFTVTLPIDVESA